MNILYHHRTQGHGAEGVHITGIVRGFERAGHRVVLCSPPGVDPFKTAGSYLYSRKKSLISRLWKLISRYSPQLVFEFIELAYNFTWGRRMRALLAREKVDFVYERYAFFLWITASLAKKRGLPFIVEVNEISGIKRARPLILRSLAKKIEKYVYAKADYVIVVSSFLKQQLVDMGVDGNKVIVMPNGVDQDMFSPKADSSSLRKTLGLENSIVMGFVGWIDPWDNLPGLLEIFSDLSKRRAGLKLLLVGDVAGKGVDRDYVSKYVEKLGLTGQVVHVRQAPRAEMPAHIGCMDICVIPDSNAFGSPIVLFEFLACGKAVVAPSVAPVLDVLHSGKNGMVFTAHDKNSFRDTLWAVVQDDALRVVLSQEARRCVESLHNWQKNSDRVMELLR